MQNNEIIRQAEYLAALNVSVIPCKADKTPIGKWKQYQTEIVSVLEVADVFKRAEAVAVVCGEVSGGLEIVDVDCKYDVDGTLWDSLNAFIEDELPGVLDRVLIQQTPSGGFHLVYRTESNVMGNKKLARRGATPDELTANQFDTVKVLIETRGEGGYALVYPSDGYSIIQGAWDALPVLTEQERDCIIRCACALNQYTEDLVPIGEQTAATTDKNGTRPGADYNERGDHADVLQAAGWKLYRNGGNTEYWTRPGKDKGVSGVWNKDTRKFAVFTSSSQLKSVLDSRTTYSLFGLFTELQHRGDFSKAAKELYAKGYGSRPLSTMEVTEDGTTIDKAMKNRQYQDVYDFVKSVCELRKNIIKGCLEILWHGEQEWQEFTDFEEDLLWSDFTQHTKINVEVFRRLINAYLSPKFDAFSEYYSTLPAWDGKDHIAHLSSTIKPIESHSKQWELYLRRWLIGITATHHGKEPNHTVLVIKGEQGVGKTRWLNNITPSVLRKDYVFVGAIDPANKDSLLMISSMWLINLDELETMNRYELGQIKSIITMKHINVRKPFARRAETLTRRASFCGSVNKSEFLTDDTGNRRYLVIEAAEIDLEAQKTVNLEQVYAQCLAAVKKGEKYWFDGKEIEEINAVNDAYRSKTLLEEIIENHVEADSEKDALNFMTPTQLQDKLREDFPALKTMNIDYMRKQMRQILASRRIEKIARKVGGVAVRGYYVKIVKREMSAEESLF